MAKSETWNIEKLKLWDKNPRSIKGERFEELKTRLNRQGQIKPLLVTKDGTVIGGNMRLRAMQSLGWTDIWVSVTDATTDKEIFDLALTDNEEFGYYEKEQLVELASSVGVSQLELSAYEVHLGSTTGLDTLVDDLGPDDVEEDEAPAVDIENEPVSKEGEVYQLGKHRLMCGSTTDAKDAAKLLGDVTIDLLMTDPPYNVDYEGGTGLKIQNDHMADAQFLAFLTDSFTCAVQYMKPGAAYYIFHADSEGHNFRQAALSAGLKLRQCLVWVKNSLVIGRQDYQWQHEPILYGWKDGGSHRWYGFFDKTTVLDNDFEPEKLTKAELVEIVKNAKAESTVIHHDKPSRSVEHPTMKPVGLVARLIKNSSKRGDLVFDGFLGSGTTLIACEQTDRVCYGFEIDPYYADVIRKRYHKLMQGDEEGWEAGTPAVEVGDALAA